MTNPTEQLFGGLERAFRHFNTELFDDQLPAVIFMLRNYGKAPSFSSKDRWYKNDYRDIADEIVLNLDHFRDRTECDALSSMVHEMCHLWQHHFGQPSRPCYHNREWAGLMESIGLMPSSTGKIGGKRTGDSIGHYILPGGFFEQSCRRLLNTGFSVPIVFNVSDESGAKKKTATRVKFTCPGCGLNVWAKPSADMGCVKCDKCLIPEILD